MPEGESEPMLHFVVQCQQRFPSNDSLQRYGLVIAFWQESLNLLSWQRFERSPTLTAETLEN
jgi:hypothetical protein